METRQHFKPYKVKFCHKCFIASIFIAVLLAIPKLTWAEDLPSNEQEGNETTEHTEEATIKLVIPGKKNLIVYLTPSEEQLLKDYLALHAEDPFLASVIKAMQHADRQVRRAALAVLKRVLYTDKHLANAKNLERVERLLQASSLDEKSDEHLLSLVSFLQLNPQLAPKLFNCLLKLTKAFASKGNVILRPYTETLVFPFLLKITIEKYPKGAQTLIKAAEQDLKGAREEPDIAFQFQILRMLGDIVDIEPVRNNPKYKTAIINIALASNKDYDKRIQSINTRLFELFMQFYPEYLKDLFATKVKLIQSPNEEVRLDALNAFELFAKSNDEAYVPELLKIATENVEDPAKEVLRHNLALVACIADKHAAKRPEVYQLALKTLAQDQDDFLTNNMALTMLEIFVNMDKSYASAALDSVKVVATQYTNETIRLKAIRLLSHFVKADGQCASEAFEVAQKSIAEQDSILRIHVLHLCSIIAQKEPSYQQAIFQLAKNTTKSDKDKQMRCNALCLLGDIAKDNESLRPELVNLATQAYQDKEFVVRKSALSELEKLVKADMQYTPAIYPLVLKGMKDKQHEVREEALKLLKIILEMDANYGKKHALQNLLQEASMDKNEKVRNDAKALLAYINKLS